MDTRQRRAPTTTVTDGATRDQPQVQRPIVFIGSSSEAVDREIVDKLALALDDAFVVHRWDTAFRAEGGRYTLEVLLDEAPIADAALLIFANDDTRDFRGERGAAARDNVVLEYGLFLAELDRERVWILEEEGVGTPSDVLGLIKYSFKSEPGPRQDADFKECVDKMRQKWGGLVPRRGGGDANLGFARTVTGQQQRIAELSSRLHKFMLNGNEAVEPLPVVLDSQSACITTYTEALERVQTRFWTTTSLSSGFWTRKQPPGFFVANDDMLRRLRDKPGAARRLFLLDQEPGQVKEAYKAFRIQQRQLDKSDELERVDREFSNLEDNTHAMLRNGMDVRVAFDQRRAYKDVLQDGMVSDPTDNELALYDDFRVDVFEGGRSGAITGVRTYTRLTRDFAAYLRSAEAYFDGLWRTAQPIDGFLLELRGAITAARAKIDYAPNWLAIYEFALDQSDQNLKTLEAERVKEILRLRDRWGRVRRVLDVGTCTARYPLALRDAVVDDGQIVGIDEDPDCVRFARANLERECPDDERVSIERHDFLAPDIGVEPGFDLITCMLGTIAHFGWDRPTSGAPNLASDQTQLALERMAGLLAPDGLLILGSWSEEACRQRDMLRIYRASDKARLARWTPPLPELKQRLVQAGLRVTKECQPEERLDLVVCEPAG
jgi:predicted nucleotide-binding protein